MIKRVLNNPLIINILIVGGVSILVKIISFFKETLVASFFGLSLILDTYLIAVLIPSLIQNVFIGALKSLFIPNYVTELKTTNKRGDFQVITFTMITLLVIALIILILLFDAFLLEIVFPGHDTSYYELIRKQLYLALPCLLFWGYSGFLAGLLEIQEKFILSTASQFFQPVLTILVLFFMRPLFGDLVLVVGLLIGSISSFLYLLFVSIRQHCLEIGKFRFNTNIKVMLDQYPAKVTSGLLTGINPFVDQFFAAQLVVGSISAINYGIKIPSFVVGILILAIGNVLLPHFSKLINDDIEKAYTQLFKILKMIFLGSLIITFFTIVFSDDIIRILFERDEFTKDDTIVVADLQRIALAYVPFYLCTLVCVRFLTAINKNRFMAWTSGWNLILNVVLNIVLVKYFAVYGLVLSTTIVYIIASIIYVGFTYKQYRQYLSRIN